MTDDEFFAEIKRRIGKSDPLPEVLTTEALAKRVAQEEVGELPWETLVVPDDFQERIDRAYVAMKQATDRFELLEAVVRKRGLRLDASVLSRAN